MGAGPFAHLRLHKLLRDDYALHHRSRPESASPASGHATVHDQEHKLLMEQAFENL